MKRVFLILSTFPLLANAYTPSIDPVKLLMLTLNHHLPLFQYSVIGIEMKEGFQTKGACSGIALNRRTILTAAHCVVDHTTNRELNLGEINLYIPFYKGKQGHKITYASSDGKIYAASDYWYQKNPAVEDLQHDLAIIKLANNLPDGKYIPEPVTLQEQHIPVAGLEMDTNDETAVTAKINTKAEFRNSQFHNPALFALGWGSRFKPEMTDAEIYSATTIACQTISSSDSYINTQINQYNLFPVPITSTLFNKLCDTNEMVSEPGDSGGPLFLQSETQEVELIGITSTNLDISSNKSYTIYTSLLENPSWKALKILVNLKS